MKNLLFLLGAAACGAALYLIYRGATLTDANLTTGTFSLRFWEAIFWLKHPPVLEDGLADNGRAWCYLLGGALTGIAGWQMIRNAGRFGGE